MNQTMAGLAEISQVACSACGSEFSPSKLGQVLVVEGSVDVVCERCNLWLFELIYTGQIGAIKEWVFKEVQ